MALRVGMIGTGSMAETMVGDFALAGLDLRAVAGRDPGRTSQFAGTHGVESALTVSQLLDADVDLVYIATTHDSHAELAEQALERGHAVLVEKAFTMNADEAARVIETARAKGLFLAEAMWMRFTPVVRLVRSLLDEGAIGSVRTVQASFGFALPLGDHRLRDAARGGGSLLDQSVYPVAFADLVLGEATTIDATGSRVDVDGSSLDVETEAAMLLGYEDGRQAVLVSSLRAPVPSGASISGSEGTIEVRAPFWGSEHLTVRLPEADERTFHLPHEGRGYVPMLRSVAHSIEAGLLEDPLSSHAMTLRVMRAVDRVRARLTAEHLSRSGG